MKKWTKENITILGLSKSGIAAAKYLLYKGANCTISESREPNSADIETIKGLEKLGIAVEMGGNKEETIKDADLIVTSPGISPKSEVMHLAKKHKVQVISEVELAFTETSKPFIAITGTNGKTTTTKLISEIFEEDGLNAPTCGNIGIPVVSLLEKTNIDYFITEMSSYQIAYSPTFKPQIGLFLNYTPDHIDWHGSEKAYYYAKAALFTGSRSPNWAVLNACDEYVSAVEKDCLSEIIYFGENKGKCSIFIENKTIIYQNNKKKEEIIKLSEIPLIGAHNYQNVMAAVAVAKISGIESDSIKSAIIKFAPPEHRLEYVDTIDGIKYYNDSKATNCDSTICALKAFENEKVVLIAGGRDKGTNLTEMIKSIKKNANAVVLIGEATQRFNEALTNAGFDKVFITNTLENAIDIAGELQEGPVLLAPACSSFDMFNNYEERGRAFKDYVRKKKKPD